MGVGAEESGRPVVATVPQEMWHTKVARFLALSWVRYTLFAALALLYVAWIGYQWQRNQLIDFNVYYISAYGFTHGYDVFGMAQEHRTTNWPLWEQMAQEAGVDYFTSPYRYPPLTAQLVVPLLGFSDRVAGIIWLVLSALAFLLSAWWLGKLWKQPEGASIVYLLFIGSVPALTTLHAGQVTPFVLLGLTLAMVGLTYQKGVLTGFSLAVAAMLKLLPIALVFYLGWRKQWLAFAVAILSLIGLMLTVPLMFGMGALQSFVVNFFALGDSGTIYATATNQALAAVLMRFLSPMVDPGVISQIYIVAALLLLGATIAFCWPMGALPAHWRLEYSLIICALMLLPPFNWYHMLVWLAIPLAVVVEQLWRRQRWGPLALVILLYMLTDVHGLLYHRFEEVRWLTSFPSIFVMLLWGLLAWEIQREKREIVQQGESATFVNVAT